MSNAIEETAEDQAAPIPVSIDREADSILIRWSDGLVTKRSAAELRAACPCATCREKKRGASRNEGDAPPGLPILSKAEAQPMRKIAFQPCVLR